MSTKAIQVLITEVKNLYLEFESNDLIYAELKNVLRVLEIPALYVEYQAKRGSNLSVSVVGLVRDCFGSKKPEAMDLLKDTSVLDSLNKHIVIECIVPSELLAALFLTKPLSANSSESGNVLFSENLERFALMCERLSKIDKEACGHIKGDEFTSLYDLFIHALVCIHYLPIYSKLLKLKNVVGAQGIVLNQCLQDIAKIDYTFAEKSFVDDLRMIKSLSIEKLKEFIIINIAMK